MEQVSFILNNPIFTCYVVPLGVMSTLAAVEILTSLIAGAGLIASVLDSWLPDLDLDVPEAETAPAAVTALSFLHVGKVPSSILLMLLLTSLGVSGIVIQLVAIRLLGSAASNWLVFPLALTAALVFVNRIGLILVRLIPADETYVINSESLVGKVAVVTLGTAGKGQSTSARVTDDLGESHKILVQPYKDDEVLTKGQEVLLVEKQGIYFKATKFNN